MTRQEAIQEIENWSCVDSGTPHIDSIDAIKIIEKIFNNIDAEFGEYFKKPYEQPYPEIKPMCRFCGSYKGSKHKDNCLHLKFMEMLK